ncbi:ABC transporter ATP-binding protein [Dysgonomonas macrotermitis]|uniref:Lipopolysaccharide transport system ATP-binding protein n=1 Tax=Dysgonomonas macrotermitis TaxID=1346286 RepID=A0A1M5DSK0_9BACT|nr:ABC transporter ATP-binding protein [Dysgonomonas macrotermitis]SHF70008.1 lipopolysaccharide transport system ATP-binding protein [Dysgonomonas macrotermitis]
MSNIAIEFENISKQYRLGTIGTGTISHDLNRWWHLVRGKEDPYLKIGEVNDRSSKATSDYVWALKDISFKVEQGDVLGIIGKNGAGKSTLLKILSRVTTPSTGVIRAKGRIASLLEVGTGFHGELTGRENIYMNGAILGMTKNEITRKLDEIVAFSGIEKYIDTPVKRYSSGMTVRLGFAIAAHLEPEILVVDEVLAVGDAEFQKKAIGKMKDVSQSGGRTVLFVSHNMSAIQSLTSKCVFLKDGMVNRIGPTEKIIKLYFEDNFSDSLENKLSFIKEDLDENKPIELLTAKIIQSAHSIEVMIEYVVREVVGSVVAIKIINTEEVSILTIIDTDNENIPFRKEVGRHSVRFQIPQDILTPNTFFMTVSFSDMKSERFDFYEKLLSFSITEYNDILDSEKRGGIIRPSEQYVITP